MKNGDQISSYLMSLNAFRVMKCKNQKDDHSHQDLILAMSLLLKVESPRNKIIRDTRYFYRFYIHYCGLLTEIKSYRVTTGKVI